MNGTKGDDIGKYHEKEKNCENENLNFPDQYKDICLLFGPS